MLSRIALLIIPLVVVACCVAENDVASPPVNENLAPRIDEVSIEGNEISTDSLIGTPVIVTFWATTCVPCRRELPMLENLTREHADEDLVVITINTGEPIDMIEDFLEEISVDLPVIVDHDGMLATEFELLFLPMTYFIDRDWVLQYRTVGEPNDKQLAHGLDLVLNPN